MGGLSKPVPVFAAVLGFFVFASAGLPGLAGFVGEFLVLLGAFDYSPWVAAVAAFCMILGAGYLLWMFQRAAFGDVSDFLRSLGSHLTDMRPVEVLTLVPLATLTVVFGLLPGLLLVLISGTVDGVLSDVAGGGAVNLAFWR